ncbi:MAG: Ribosomal RNA small subunit methyltransferase I [Candidatus Azambacteria bacterium GW2011_GWB2_46_37]|uniref:Ribosomal RNA small subunit methyltransferase I n=6 Tax=Candidatus Azamiibacteriota TaxID=1752741 RepID=A0A0G1SAM9_9BACT|nr:MAG: Ribosomal RNA small subunit methyltransferase I [Candidatus Azambacteria bacterium GW2011_GWA2_45_90]KKU22742.1 MAG: Ribosomal RNA small subunit methyltransferase I [Candidatus Azambacteria bacterium GW2011_GWC1_46_13]KKU36558.1 MAG: Ribosomal RNA small subunit methyltransferase I [Candidatus Azambacteria bacterium GW2011_GWF2_46_32]KKU39103.1 MAG: Ribosomal RNA small subunit methyltransferase I [Candidatus Azambacteria bacterium GW2011_GWE2_46_45]KKU39462.1 MAG: Ribosomal RNA small sub
MTTLYIVATPIGNLEDASLRALRILKEVDAIACEDTRVTKKLLDRYEIKKPLLSYHQHAQTQKVIELIEQGKNIAYVSDAGTPGISDPGGKLVEAVVERFGSEARIVPIPGPCAAIAALSISGFPADEFLFLGFPPHKKGRQTFFRNLAEEAKKRTVVFYESPHRILKTLEEIKNLAPDANLVVCRELTKKFETTYRGNPEKVIESLKIDKILGEFVIVVKGFVQKSKPQAQDF